ncbi:MAG: hypothetical protein FJ150_05235 [Euryarchaeota archaeon]|nr:hypothetical protein [Euryarchaeota archaeon]
MEIKTKILVALVIIASVAFISYIQIFGLSFEGKESDFYLPTVSEDNASAYKAFCTELNIYKVLENPNSLIGQKVKVKGELLKKLENPDNTTDILLKVPELAKYPYVIVRYSDKITYKEGDKLEVYGEYSRLSLIENEKPAVMVPSINAVYIEKV